MKASRIDTHKISRLTQQAAFDRLRGLRDPQHRWTAKSLSLQIYNDETINKPHIGISVSRKTAKRAVDRNRIKRRLRAAAASILRIHAAPHTHYLISGRSAALTRSFDELQNDIKWCIGKLSS